ncbi:SDR family oxidoreductase [Senegalimassilia faecalis]|uniref:SDR family oxidoreductase n=1 Tax=Senegalimassilia faecalis TaxID=2509433 RepID=UPI003A96E075
MRLGPQETVWIAGAAGRMGQAIEHALDHSRYKVVTTDAEIDVTDLHEIMNYAESYRPDFVINCAALASRTEADEDPDKAYKVNALGARNLAIASNGVGATLVHLSTDDLFPENADHAFNEFDATNPPHVYGKSKQAGERFVRELCQRHIIVRSSWVYTAQPDDLLGRALKASTQGKTVPVPANQFACPTSADTFARFVLAVMESDEFGTFHAACTGVTSRFEFFERAFALAGQPTGNLRGTANPRQGYRIELDDMMARLTGVFAMPTWEDDLAAFAAEHDLAALACTE